MTKQQAVKFGEPLTNALREMFHKTFWTHCGKHWLDINDTPDKFAQKNIEVQLIRAEKANYGGSIMLFDIVVRSFAPAYVHAAYAPKKIKSIIFDVLKSTDLQNEYVDFVENAVVFVVQSGGYWFHIKVLNRFSNFN